MQVANVKDLVKKAFGGLAIIILGLGLLGTVASEVKTMPDNATLIVDTTKNVYFAPPYLEEVVENNSDKAKEIEQKILNGTLVKMTAKDIRTKKFSPDPECRDEGFFVQDGRSLTMGLIGKIGIIPKQKSRWNKDGSWNF